MMFVLASLFEETGFIPSRMEKHFFFRISLGIWSIMSVVITNGYNGIMISELNSPQQQFHPESFDQLECHNRFKVLLQYDKVDKTDVSESTKKQIENDKTTWRREFFSLFEEVQRLYGPIRLKKGKKDENNYSKTDPGCYRLLSVMHPIRQKVVPAFLGVLFNLAIGYLESFRNIVAFRELSLLTSKNAFYPKGMSHFVGNASSSVLQEQVEREVVKCWKTVFIGRSSEIKVEYGFLSRKYPDVKFFISAEAVQRHPSGIYFEYGGKSRVMRQFEGIIEAGIWTHLERWELSGVNLNRIPAIKMQSVKDFKPINIASLRGTWPTVFILVGSFCAFAVLVFIIESRRSIWLLVGNVPLFIRNIIESLR